MFIAYTYVYMYCIYVDILISPVSSHGPLGKQSFGAVCRVSVYTNMYKLRFNVCIYIIQLLHTIYIIQICVCVWSVEKRYSPRHQYVNPFPFLPLSLSLILPLSLSLFLFPTSHEPNLHNCLFLSNNLFTSFHICMKSFSFSFLHLPFSLSLSLSLSLSA